MMRRTLVMACMAANALGSPHPFPAAAGREAPRPEKRPKDVSVHGDVRIDPWFWLREEENPEVLAHLRAENAHTEAVLAPLSGLRGRLVGELRGRMKETDRSAEAPYRGWLHSTRTEAGKEHEILCRRRAEPGAPEEVIVDVNALAEGRDYAEMGDWSLSRSGSRFLCTMDWTGGRDYTLLVRDLETRRDLAHPMKDPVADAVWAGDDDTIYCLTEDEAKRACRLHRLSLRRGTVDLLFEEKDELFDLTLTVSRDFRWVFCTSASKTTSEVRAWPAADPQSSPVLIRPRETDHEYTVDHHEGRFLIVTNKDAKNFRVMAAPVDRPDAWQELIPHRPAVKVESIDVFRDFMALEEREDGLPRLSLHTFADGATRRLTVPDAAWDLAPALNLEYETAAYRFVHQSMVSPPATMEVDARSLARRVVKQREVPGHDPARYVTRREWAVSADGTRIPLSILHRADLDRSRPQPLHLTGYGSYGISESAAFSSSALCLVDRGAIHVIAHVRGGGELGEPWREAGRMARKMTTFTDFTSCAEWLIRQGWTTSDRLVISGGSAGGLLMGAAVNLRPDLFRAAVLDVPFVDVLNTMLDDSLPLTTSEYVEWGNPNVKEEYGWMRAWSPYDNLTRRAYPHLLVNVGFNDSQVPYWEGAKYAARVRDLNTGDSTVLLHCDLGAGHGGLSGRYEALPEEARTLAFQLAALALADK